MRIVRRGPIQDGAGAPVATPGAALRAPFRMGLVGLRADGLPPVAARPPKAGGPGPWEGAEVVWREGLCAARELGEPVRFEYRGQARGEERLFLATVAPLDALPDATFRFSYLVDDVTEQRQAERALTEAKEAAEEANRAKSAFLATMSHEIRTPLNAVLGLSDLLLETTLSGDQREFINIIRSSGEALLILLNDILDLSKIEAGRIELEAEPFDLQECVESALDMLSAKAAEKGIELAYDIDPRVPGTVLGDVTRIRQILVNLLSNGVKFTHHGEVVLSVMGGPKDGGRHELHVTVRDTGIGIPPHRLDALFESFYQVDASITRKYGGTGLGLAISKRLAEQMGGMIWVESEEGQGSTFHVTLVVEAAVQQGTSLRGVQPGLAGKRVLIVDDSEAGRHFLLQQLAEWGMHPEALASGTEALGRLEAGGPFDLVLLDLIMPGLDGVTLAHRIRARWGAEELPLVLLSAVRNGTQGAGTLFEALLPKPVKQQQLLQTLQEVLQQDHRSLLFPVTSLAAERQSRMRQALAASALRILLAEDDPVNQKVILRLLSRQGYVADVVGSGTEVLDALAQEDYDVVLMDWRMPGLDGLATTREVRKRYPGRDLYIIGVTAQAMHGDAEQCLEAGMDAYLSKPVRFAELSAALDRCLARRGSV